MAHPLKRSQRKRQEPKLGEPKLGEPKLAEPKLVEPDGLSEIPIAQELQGESVSDTLIRARQQIGQDLRSIAEVLCIRYSYLDAIERGQYENLPGATYAVGFVRSYAEYLGLDGEQVVERFKTEVEGLDKQTKLHFPTPAPEGKMPGGAVFLVAALLFAGAYGVWFYLSNKGESLGDLVAPVPEQLQAMVEGDSPSTGTETGTEGAGTGDAVAENAPPATVAPTVEAETAPQSAALPASAGGEPAPEAAAAEAPVEAPAEAVAEAVTAEPATPSLQSAPAPVASAQPAETVETSPAPAASAEAPAATQAEAARPAADQATTEPAATDQAASGQVTAATPEAPEAPSAPASGAPLRGDAYAIPVAPENNAPATAFLTNHQPQVYGSENADARIVLKATQDAWVQVRDRQGTLLLTRVLRVGDSYKVPNQDDLTLLTGNAGGLEISVDGRTLAPLGPVGAVRRNIPLTPEGLAGSTPR
ncbi:MAG: hypothetical protein Tsb0032_17490 [Kiloniellaceae bacterium]